MNFRNRYLVIAIRTLLGLIMLASGISGLLMGNSTQGVPEQMVAFTQVFWASGIFQMVKVTEIAAGFMLVFGIFPALATLFLAPDVVGIVIVNARLMPSFLWLGGIVFVLTWATRTGTSTSQSSHPLSTDFLLMAATGAQQPQRHARLFLHLGISVL